MVIMGDDNMRFSFEGWRIMKWLHGNKEAIKLIVAAIGTISVFGITLEGAVIAIAVKAVLDVVDYYFSEVEN